MEWLDFAKYVATVLGGTGIVSLFVKELILHWMDKGVERYKHELNLQLEEYKGDLSLQAEKYRSELQIITNEHSVKFLELHSKRANIICELYESLTRLDMSLKSFLAPLQEVGEPSLTEKITNVSIEYNKISSYYFAHKLFFGKDTCILFEKILEEIKDIFYDVTMYPIEYNDPEYKFNRNLSKEKREIMRESWKKVTGEISEAKEKLENNFRKLLGVS